ncbi:MAG: response regulator [Methanobacterium sp.]
MDKLVSVKILLVEDNPADSDLILNYFKNSDDIQIELVVDGAEALDYLYGRKNHVDVSLPDIIILDMNLPKIDGMAVLETIKDYNNLKNIPVIVFGTSNDSEEIKNAYKAHANCYIVKPINFDKLNNILECIENFWTRIVILPDVDH